MREIEFRGKTKDGRWVYGLYVNYSAFEEGLSDSAEIIRHSIKRYDGGDIEDIDPETRGQYTGIESMDGERIFEGDIIKHFPTDLFVVTFEDCAFWAKYKDGRFELSHRHAYWKVIGNIHDNPELLEVGA